VHTLKTQTTTPQPPPPQPTPTPPTRTPPPTWNGGHVVDARHYLHSDARVRPEQRGAAHAHAAHADVEPLIRDASTRCPCCCLWLICTCFYQPTLTTPTPTTPTVRAAARRQHRPPGHREARRALGPPSRPLDRHRDGHQIARLHPAAHGQHAGHEHLGAPQHRLAGAAADDELAAAWGWGVGWGLGVGSLELGCLAGEVLRF